MSCDARVSTAAGQNATVSFIVIPSHVTLPVCWIGEWLCTEDPAAFEKSVLSVDFEENLCYQFGQRLSHKTMNKDAIAVSLPKCRGTAHFPCT